MMYSALNLKILNHLAKLKVELKTINFFHILQLEQNCLMHKNRNLNINPKETLKNRSMY